MNKTISLALILAFCLSSTLAKSQSTDPLAFPKESFTEKTRKVKTSAGEKVVTYHLYSHIPYVSRPIDLNYQSLNVSVPVKINDTDVDAKNSPILFSNGVGGYMSASNAQGSRGGGPPATRETR